MMCERCPGVEVNPMNRIQHLASWGHFDKSIEMSRIRNNLSGDNHLYVVTSSSFKGRQPALPALELLQGLAQWFQVQDSSYDSTYQFFVLKLAPHEATNTGDRRVAIGEHRVLIRRKTGMCPFEKSEVYDDANHEELHHLTETMMGRATALLGLTEDHCDMDALMNAHIEKFIFRNKQYPTL